MSAVDSSYAFFFGLFFGRLSHRLDLQYELEVERFYEKHGTPGIGMYFT